MNDWTYAVATALQGNGNDLITKLAALEQRVAKAEDDIGTLCSVTGAALAPQTTAPAGERGDAKGWVAWEDHVRHRKQLEERAERAEAEVSRLQVGVDEHFRRANRIERERDAALSDAATARGECDRYKAALETLRSWFGPRCSTLAYEVVGLIDGALSSSPPPARCKTCGGCCWTGGPPGHLDRHPCPDCTSIVPPPATGFCGKCGSDRIVPLSATRYGCQACGNQWSRKADDTTPPQPSPESD